MFCCWKIFNVFLNFVFMYHLIAISCRNWPQPQFFLLLLEFLLLQSWSVCQGWLLYHDQPLYVNLSNHGCRNCFYMISWCYRLKDLYQSAVGMTSLGSGNTPSRKEPRKTILRKRAWNIWSWLGVENLNLHIRITNVAVSFLPNG